MSKSILIINTPDSCMGCNFLYCDVENNAESCVATEEARNVDLEKEEKPDWCPLKEIPQRKEKIKYCGNGVLGINDMAKAKFNDGYNACIDEILKERD